MLSWRDPAGEVEQQRIEHLRNVLRWAKDAFPDAQVLRVESRFTHVGETVAYLQLAGGQVLAVSGGRVQLVAGAIGDTIFNERPRTSKPALRLISSALRLLGPADRERYAEEWAADLAEQVGWTRQVSFALGTLHSAVRLALQRAAWLMER